jgi:hypothetical protein
LPADVERVAVPWSRPWSAAAGDVTSRTADTSGPPPRGRPNKLDGAGRSAAPSYREHDDMEAVALGEKYLAGSQSMEWEYLLVTARKR